MISETHYLAGAALVFIPTVGLFFAMCAATVLRGRDDD